MLNTTIAHYKIIEKIGAGGMGEVYRARDTKLGRDVAVKMLPESVTADADRVARFEREAKVLASFSHAGIASIYGVEEKDGARFLILEMVEGEDLAQRLQRGPLTIEDALDIARQIADAMEAAHDQGIIHRDLKPANIIVTPDGGVKVLDFGLAKALDTSVDSEIVADISNSPTLMTHSPTINSPTMAGIILGTAAYMSPEQARGKPVDRRADIWAFGVVLCEMLTGKRLFQGETVSDTLAAVLRAELDFGDLPSGTPPAVRRLLARTLERDKRRRMQAMGEARIILEDVAAGKTGDGDAFEGAGGRGKKSAMANAIQWTAFGVAALIVLFMMSKFMGGRRDDRPASAKVVSNVLTPEGAAVDTEFLSVALTRDGSRIAFVGVDESGQVHLYVRGLDHEAARRLPGTAGAERPFWSPDGRQVAFSANGVLYRTDIDGGQPDVIAQGTFHGTWGPGDRIILSDDTRRLFEANASGGEVKVWLDGDDPDNELGGLQSPQWLPNGRGALFTVVQRDGGGAIWAADADASNLKQLLPHLTNAVYVAPGYLLYMVNDNLMAAAFDADKREVVGEAMQVASPVQQRNYPFYGFFAAAADNGTILFVPGVGGAAQTELVWVDRAGKDIGQPIVTGDLYNHRLSRDQRRVALDISQAETTHGDIWVYDFARGSSLRMTAHPSDESRPVWGVGDREVFFIRLSNIYKQRLASDVEAERVYENEYQLAPSDLSSDGRTLVFREFKNGKRSIRLYDFETGEARDYLRDDGRAMQSRLSPDNRWIAYNSDATGSDEVYIESFPERGERFQVSDTGGGQPIWRGDGRELYYYDFDSGDIMAVPIDMDAVANPIGKPVALFATNLRDDDYDVSTDGQRFLLNRRLDRAPVHSLVLIQNWAAGLNP